LPTQSGETRSVATGLVVVSGSQAFYSAGLLLSVSLFSYLTAAKVSTIRSLLRR